MEEEFGGCWETPQEAVVEVHVGMQGPDEGRTELTGDPLTCAASVQQGVKARHPKPTKDHTWRDSSSPKGPG